MLSNMFINAVVLTLAMAFATIVRKGSGHVTPTWLLVYLLGFYVGQKVLNTGYQSLSEKLPGLAVEQTGPVTFKHRDTASIYQVGVTPDGLIALTNTATSVHVWNVKTGQELWSLPYQGGGKLSSTGKFTLARGNINKGDYAFLQLYDTASGKLLAQIKELPFTGRLHSDYLSFSHDDTYLLVGSDQLEVALYSLKNLENVAELQPIIVPREIPASTHGLPASYKHMGFFGDDESIFVHAFDTMERWSVEQHPRLLSAIRFANTIKFSPSKFSDDGSMVFYCSSIGLRLADSDASIPSEVQHFEMEADLPPGSYSLRTPCAVSPDNRWIAAGFNEGSGRAKFQYMVNIWETDGTPRLGDADPEPSNAADYMLVPQARELSFSPDSSLLFVADEALRLHAYALSSDIKVAVIPPEQVGFTIRTPVTPLLAASNRGAVLSYHGASQAVWMPIDKPVSSQDQP